MGYIAFQLNKNSTKELLHIFKPAFSNIKCHHITYKFGISPTTQLPLYTNGYVIGYKKGIGIEALVVSINNTTIRPDGKSYHITLSHDDAHKPMHSNNLLADNSYDKLKNKIYIQFTAGYFK